MTTKIKCKVLLKGDLVNEIEFLDAIVKIGRLSSSHLHLEGIARMHAVLERTGSTWRLIDLGSSMGTMLDGEYIDKNTVLPKEGRMGFGDWTIEYEVLPASQEILDQMMGDLGKERMGHELDKWDAEHHRTMLEGLLEEVARLSTRAAKQIEETGLARAWATMATESKRGALRKLVGSIRYLRQEDARVQRQRVASMLELGPEGILAVYDLEPEQALDRAQEALTSVSVAKGALEWLVGMDLVAKAQKAAGEEKEDATVAALVAGHAKLIERLQTTMSGGSALLLAYLSRAGGHELSDEDRFQMKRAFDEIERESERGPSANEPNSE